MACVAANQAVLPNLLVIFALLLLLVATQGPDCLAGLLRMPSPSVAVAAVTAVSCSSQFRPCRSPAVSRFAVRPEAFSKRYARMRALK